MEEEEATTISPIILRLLKRLDDSNNSLGDILQDIHADEKFDHNLSLAAKKQAPGFFQNKKVDADTALKFFGLNFLKTFTLVSLMKEVINEKNLWFESCFIAKASQMIAEKLECDSKLANDVFIAGLFLKFGEAVKDLEANKDRSPYTVSAELVASFKLKTKAHEILEDFQRQSTNTHSLEITIVEVALNMLESQKHDSKSMNRVFNNNKKLLNRMNKFGLVNIVSSKLLREALIETKKISFFADELVNTWL